MPREHAHFVLPTEALMDDFDSFRKDLKSILTPSDALLDNNELLKVWMRQANVPEKVIMFRGHAYMSVPHKSIDDLCEWIKKARDIFTV